MQNCNLIIKAKYVLPMDNDLNIIENGMVVVSGNKILQVGKVEDLKNQYSAREVIDCGNSIIMPGLINTHTHAAMAYFRGLADDLPLTEWLEKHIWPAEAKFVKPDFVRKASELACLEMIKSGITFFNDMYYFSGVTAEACKQVGIRAMLSDAIIDFPAPSYKNADEAISLFKEFYNKYKDDELINISIQPHAIYTCCKKTLIKIKELAQEFNIPIHIHISETKKEVDDCKKQHGKSPVEYLDKIGFLSDKVIAAHSVWLSNNDLEIYKNRGVKVSHCPMSNMKLASGIAPIPEMLKMGITIGIGTDSAASNNTLDIFSEMRTCA
ncbi:amidohydrolase, partial [Candidatus Parcubacteria bacterium]|nr:amidohydrolase [Candidatus Parcubacteria bacterium]